MHIILGLLGAIVTIIILVRRLSDAGIDIGWLDPFKWQRRRQWKMKYHAKPVYSIDTPMKATAGILYTMVRCTGDISREEKTYLLSVFKSDFQLSDREATDLLSDCSFYIKDENLVKDNLKKYLTPSFSEFTSSQKESALSLVTKVAECEGGPNDKQQEFLNQLEEIFAQQKSSTQW